MYNAGHCRDNVIDLIVCWWVMTETLPTQEQVDQIARELAPDVVRIRFTADWDWTGDPAFHFKVVLSDDAMGAGRFLEVRARVRARLVEGLALADSARIPYFRFRGESDQAKIREASWE